MLQHGFPLRTPGLLPSVNRLSSMVLAVGHGVGSALLPLALALTPVPICQRLEDSPAPSALAIRQQIFTAAQNGREIG